MNAQMKEFNENGGRNAKEQRLAIKPCTAWKTVQVNGKMTNVPAEWKTCKLEECADIFSGGTPTKTKENYDGKIPWVTTTDLNGGVVLGTKKNISEKGLKSSSARMVKPKTIFFAMYGASIGKMAMAGLASATNQSVACIFSEKNSNEYLFYNLLINKNAISSLSAGSGQPNISQAILKNFEISAPQPKEQRLISTILTTQETLISNQKAYITAQKQLLTYLMDNLLSGRLRVRAGEGDQIELYENTEWKSVEVNGKMMDVPVEWRVEKTGDVARNISGGTPKTSNKSFWGGGVLWVTPRDLSSLNGVYVEKTFKTLTQAGAEVLKAKSIPKNTLIFSTRGSIGNIAISSTEMRISQSCEGFFFKSLDVKYSYFYFLKNMSVLFGMGAGTTFKSITSKDIKKVDIVSPEIKEQNLISTILTTQETLISKLEAKLDLEQQKMTWLLDNLLSGKYLVSEAP